MIGQRDERGLGPLSTSIVASRIVDRLEAANFVVNAPTWAGHMP
jgi:hypothetical protein